MRVVRWLQGHIDSIVNWLTIVALSFALGRSFAEIMTSLHQTARFRFLSVLFLVIAVPVVLSLVVKLLLPDGDAIPSSGLRLRRTLWVLALLNLAVPAVAIETALTINPNYDFGTPLLRFSAKLMHQLWS